MFIHVTRYDGPGEYLIPVSEIRVILSEFVPVEDGVEAHCVVVLKSDERILIQGSLNDLKEMLASPSVMLHELVSKLEEVTRTT